jgi:surface carbohydrate biosynthesis protein
MMRSLYLPVTSQPRELDSKILLALVAAERGMRGFIGYKTSFVAMGKKLNPGVILVHNARQRAKSIRLFTESGHRVIVLDEEALVRQSDEIFLKKHSPGDFDDIEHLLCWGRDDLNLWRGSNLGLRCGISVVGNPRFDLLRPEVREYHAAQVASLRRSLGEYVLLNTNFPTVNNITPQGAGLRLAGWAKDDLGRQLEASFLANKRKMFEATLALVRPLAEAIAPTLLVIRPHPNEDHAPWMAAAENTANVRVVFEGSVIPWLLGARVLVHNNCTTAVEAAAAGTPVLNFRPWQSEFDNDLSHAFGVNCVGATELAAAIKQIVPGQSIDKAYQDRLKHYIESVSGELSCERIVSLVQDIPIEKGSEEKADLLERLRENMGARSLWLKRAFRLYARRSGRRRLAVLRKNFPGLNPLRMDANFLNYSAQQFELFARQFPPLSETDIQDRISRFAKALGRFGGVQATIVDPTLLIVQAGGLPRVQIPGKRRRNHE